MSTKNANPLAGIREDRRKKELQRLATEFSPPLLEIQKTPPSPWQHWVLWTLLSLLLIALLWAYFGKMEIVSTAAGEFVPNGRVKVVQPAALAVVQQILVHDGEMVQKGQILVRLNPTSSRAKLQAVEGQLQIQQLTAERLRQQLGEKAPLSASAASNNLDWQMQQALRAAEEAAYRAQLRQVEVEQAANSAQISSLQTQKITLGQQLAILHREAQNDELLSQEGAIARQDFENVQQHLLAVESQYTQTQGQLASAQQEQARLETKLQEIRQNYRAQLLQNLSKNSLSVLSLQANRTQMKEDLDLQELRAPISGIVQNLSVRNPGQVVQPAQAVASIVPVDTPLIVEADMPDSKMAFVHVGEKARVKVSAYPFEQYGALLGKVTRISPDAQKADKAAGGALYYHIWVDVPHPILTIAGAPVTMRPGMSVTVDIHTGKRRILQFFLGPILRNWQEGLSVR
ncbi:MAG: HlyD family type I secretion periplasmic adaptor subunit [Acidithiobacillus sp.]|nr:HlyD family type I secretion periplasmic adaptor subunit [Acidithiobacillus sp.]